MKIGCVTRHPYPTEQEVRVAKFAATLDTRGHEFFVFCPEGNNQRSSDTFVHGHIIRPVTRLKPFFRKLAFVPLPINFVWAWWLFVQFRKNSIDLVIVRDLRLAVPVFVAARAWGIKAILDLGEHYPGMMEVLVKQNVAHLFLRNKRLITWLEALSVRMADRVWVVVEENLERLRPYSSRITVINNYPVSIDNELSQKIEPRVYSDTGEPVTLVSIGVIDNIRGLELAIDSFEILLRALENTRMIIYGDGFFRKNLESQVSSLGLESRITFGGWISAAKKYEILAMGDIALLLHKVCDLTQHTVPNKLFDYMSVGLPVVSTKLSPITRILKSEQCGIAVDENAETVARAIEDLILDVEKRRRFAANGRRAVNSRYKWDSEEKKILRDIGLLTESVS